MSLNYVLASGSSHKKTLLERLKIDFEIRIPDIDESQQVFESPENLVQRLSKEKAWTVFESGEELIIGSDQLAVYNGMIEGKPLIRGENIEQLKRFSGQTVTFLTGLHVTRSDKRLTREKIVNTAVRFRQLSLSEIERYVDNERAYDCTGGFKAEGLGITLMESITSDDPTAIVGLPLIALSRFLKELDI
jgi:septum formation protein